MIALMRRSFLAVDLFRCLSLYVFQLVDLSLFEQGVLEHQIVILLFDLMKIIHVELK